MNNVGYFGNEILWKYVVSTRRNHGSEICIGMMSTPSSLDVINTIRFVCIMTLFWKRGIAHSPIQPSIDTPNADKSTKTNFVAQQLNSDDHHTKNSEKNASKGQISDRKRENDDKPIPTSTRSPKGSFTRTIRSKWRQWDLQIDVGAGEEAAAELGILQNQPPLAGAVLEHPIPERFLLLRRPSLLRNSHPFLPSFPPWIESDATTWLGARCFRLVGSLNGRPTNRSDHPQAQ